MITWSFVLLHLRDAALSQYKEQNWETDDCNQSASAEREFFDCSWKLSSVHYKLSKKTWLQRALCLQIVQRQFPVDPKFPDIEFHSLSPSIQMKLPVK